MDSGTKKEDYGNYYKGIPKKGDWLSIYEQIRIVHKLQVKSFVEIGVASKVLSNFFRNKDYEVTTVDINDEFKPDITADLRKMPLKPHSTELVMAFQVLEHMPFKEFVKSLQEFRRVSKKYVVLSLPYDATHINIRIQIPYFRFHYQFNKPSNNKNKKKGWHYWELGRKGFEVKKIEKIILDQGFSIVESYALKDNPYHYFFILKV